MLTGKETIIYKFKKGSLKNVHPQGVIYHDGLLYGATGGDGYSDHGSIYKLDPVTGVKTQLYSFKGNHDASYPNSLLTYHDGALYGTSGYDGGASRGSCPGNGDSCGTVFKVDIATGAETVLHRFRNDRDGGMPVGGVIYQDGALYGTARDGGFFRDKCNGEGCGTVFKPTLPDEPATR
jgi:uncharacterized repeat protein (TIGR03803 family)